MAKTENKAPVADSAEVKTDVQAEVPTDAPVADSAEVKTDAQVDVQEAPAKASAKDEKDYRLTRAYVHGHTLLARDEIITLNARQAEFLLADGTIVEV